MISQEHKAALKRAKSNNVCIIEWLKPRLYERKKQLADRAAGLVMAEPEDMREIREGDWVLVKSHHPGNIVELFQKAIGFPEDWFMTAIVMLLNLIEEFQPDNTVKGGKKNA